MLSVTVVCQMTKEGRETRSVSACVVVESLDVLETVVDSIVVSSKERG